MKNLRFCIPLLLAALGLALGLATQVSAQQKTVIAKASDLPRRSITINGRASEVVEDLPRLLGYADTLIQNLEADLNRYEIQDRAALKSYYESLLGLYFFKDNYEKALSFIPKIQALCDKNAEKITTGLFLQAYAKAYAKEKNPSAEAFQKEFAQQYAALWKALPYAEVAEDVESMKGRLSILNPELIGATLDTQIQTFLDNNKGVVPEGVAGTFINIRMARDRQIPLKDIMLKIFTDLYSANQSQVSKTNIWTAREVNFTGQENYAPVVAFVWDSGVDMGVIPAQNRFQDAQGRSGLGYSMMEAKKDGLLLEDPSGKIKSDVSRLQLLTKGFMDLQAAIESPEAQEVRRTISILKKEEVEAFNEELGFYGNYSHGTHVAGIVAAGNPFIRLGAIRMFFEYRTLPPPHTREKAAFVAQMYREIVQYLKANRVRVVNMSWRYNASAYEGLLALHGIGKDEQERKEMARELFDIEKKALYEAFKSAPEILFVCGAGNENNSADFSEYIPATFTDLPNLITIGAVDSEGKKTDFTTEGKSVRFYANGYEIESFVPGGAKIKFSGTSMASPQVANLAAKMLALRPELSPAQLIQYIENGADALPEDPNLRLVNPQATLQLLKKSK